ncbi:potassium channel family protein [Streptomyces sp. JJ36]|uniref:potassium channel family protein n=1 Tax=Streptomyces sp. JJ36 TaxID=2736645 RepID=UPI001F1FCFBC|nr:potassium channel family protein [Streptomyces sp. JJ36]MCF6524741.1 two pore domain potassium channel family protein [Streptomyces sp. JJ36]
MGYPTPPEPGEENQARWERHTQAPLLGMSVLFAVAYALPIVRPGIGDGGRLACLSVEWVVWAAFAVDYGVRLYLAPHRLRFVRSHPLALVAVALPLVKPLRLLRLVSALLLAGQRARMASQVRLTTYVAGSCAGLLVFGSLAVLEVERDAPGSSIRTFGDAVWWAFTTMTTVGYGDLAPTTPLGRLLAIGLMLSGIALLGVVTANIAAWFVARVEREDAESERHAAALAALTTEVRELRAELAELRATPGAARAAPAQGGVPAESPGP